MTTDFASAPSTRPWVIANWKMNGLGREVDSLLSAVLSSLPDHVSQCDVGIAPPFTALHLMTPLQTTGVSLGAQNCFWQDKGAFTGEIGAPFLKELGCSFVLIGHSERRQLLGETDEMVAKKVRHAVNHRMSPVICVGETLEERESGRAEQVVLRQVRGALEGLAPEVSEVGILTFAYEPVWAIGTGKTSAPSDAQSMHATIRGELQRRWGADARTRIRILYGGSVNAQNAASLLSQPDIDGALVGGASLDPGAFGAIVQAAVSSSA
jgi:triosephosphate isomerase